jgi:TolA-binding protein
MMTSGREWREIRRSGKRRWDREDYSGAEREFRRLLHILCIDKKLGEDSNRVLDAQHWLGRTLFQQEKYSEAEEQLQLVSHWEEKRSSQEVVENKYWLGNTLLYLEDHIKAEELLRQVVRWYETNMDQDYTLHHSRYWLGLTLYQLENYSEAKELLEQYVHWSEKEFGKDYADTSYGSYWLAITLYELENYSKAKELFEQHVHWCEKKFGKDYADTFDGSYWLAITLYELKNYEEAKELLEQVVSCYETRLGTDHKVTDGIKFWLGKTLFRQGKSSEARAWLEKVVLWREKNLGKDDSDTLVALRLLERCQPEASPLPMVTNTQTALPQSTDMIAQENLISRLSNFFLAEEDRRESYTDPEIFEISTLLNHLNPRWSKHPRTYIILRRICYLDSLDDLINVGFSDYWLPVTEQKLPDCLRPSARAAFINAQNIVLTKSMHLEKAEEGQHCSFQRGESTPFEFKEFLGSGGYGKVDRVLSQISYKEYARKRVLRSAAFRGRRKEDVERFIAEIEILKRLKHRHIVEYVGSYTDPKYIGLIMAPAAKMDLRTYLEQASASDHPELRTFFGCLAAGLEFLHTQKVRHKDIKPRNILVNHGNVLFADFGLSLDFTDANGSTTVSMVKGMTRRYCAPEVASEEPRNTMSDIWSLGVVFMEMIVVLKGKPVQYLDQFFTDRGATQVFIRTNLNFLPVLIASLEVIGKMSDNKALGWTQHMLTEDQRRRPTASKLVTTITALSEEGDGAGFCGTCCFDFEEDFSDRTDE